MLSVRTAGQTAMESTTKGISSCNLCCYMQFCNQCRVTTIVLTMFMDTDYSICAVMNTVQVIGIQTTCTTNKKIDIVFLTKNMLNVSFGVYGHEECCRVLFYTYILNSEIALVLQELY